MLCLAGQCGGGRALPSEMCLVSLDVVHLLPMHTFCLRHESVFPQRKHRGEHHSARRCNACVCGGIRWGRGCVLRLGRLGGRRQADVLPKNVPSGCCGRWPSSEENLHASDLFLHCGVRMEQEESACRGMEEAERSAPRPLARRFRNHSFKATQLQNLGHFGGYCGWSAKSP